ncbi:MTH1187 family thiamine-binding protein [Humisphaera borealis]|uniref:MTH1187 family thiamine-binding protein n=1 Tax=Humisphaera borealis TaxID=2807512 RepID=A0A7M2WTZ0_9BACT|nr:MTH1187 family thiamine-binding protein [Humisphaera borealis]QOV88946.1 MTH1187 family thiamine-binding protein [Humisphaera borealis]
MLLAEISMWPMDKGQSVSPYVARVLDIIDRSGLPYRLGPLGTSIEGEWDEVMAVVKQCFDALAADSERVAITMKCDWRKGRSGSLEGKIASVEQQLGRKLRT